MISWFKIRQGMQTVRFVTDAQFNSLLNLAGLRPSIRCFFREKNYHFQSDGTHFSLDAVIFEFWCRQLRIYSKFLHFKSFVAREQMKKHWHLLLWIVWYRVVLFLWRTVVVPHAQANEFPAHVVFVSFPLHERGQLSADICVLCVSLFFRIDDLCFFFFMFRRFSWKPSNRFQHLSGHNSFVFMKCRRFHTAKMIEIITVDWAQRQKFH